MANTNAFKIPGSTSAQVGGLNFGFAPATTGAAPTPSPFSPPPSAQSGAPAVGAFAPPTGAPAVNFTPQPAKPATSSTPAFVPAGTTPAPAFVPPGATTTTPVFAPPGSATTTPAFAPAGTTATSTAPAPPPTFAPTAPGTAPTTPAFSPVGTTPTPAPAPAPHPTSTPAPTIGSFVPQQTHPTVPATPGTFQPSGSTATPAAPTPASKREDEEYERTLSGKTLEEIVGTLGSDFTSLTTSWERQVREIKDSEKEGNLLFHQVSELLHVFEDCTHAETSLKQRLSAFLQDQAVLAKEIAALNEQLSRTRQHPPNTPMDEVRSSRYAAIEAVEAKLARISEIVKGINEKLNPSYLGSELVESIFDSLEDHAQALRWLDSTAEELTARARESHEMQRQLLPVIRPPST